jgi:hypothetical protein
MGSSASDRPARDARGTTGHDEVPVATFRHRGQLEHSPAKEGACMTKEIDMIEVRQTAEQDPLIFEVVVRDGKGETRHHVTMSRETCERLTSGKHTPERCLDAAFRFLLDREPKESILRRFDITAISRYFPEFEREIPRYL